MSTNGLNASGGQLSWVSQLVRVIEHFSQHLRVCGHRNILIRRDLGVAMRQEIHRDAAADVRQSSQLVPPQMLIQHHAMHEERDRPGSSGCVADAA
jgi:hypothetical protein